MESRAAGCTFAINIFTWLASSQVSMVLKSLGGWRARRRFNSAITAVAVRSHLSRLRTLQIQSGLIIRPQTRAGRTGERRKTPCIRPI